MNIHTWFIQLYIYISKVAPLYLEVIHKWVWSRSLRGYRHFEWQKEQVVTVFPAKIMAQSENFGGRKLSTYFLGLDDKAKKQYLLMIHTLSLVNHFLHLRFCSI